eukprot:8644198-Alexandrium_andersonii.AAC.1
MPFARETTWRRCKLADSIYPFQARVAGPVGKAEILRTSKAQEAEAKEWAQLRERHVWDESRPPERKD